MKFIYSLLLVFISCISRAQTQSQWAQTVNWDGVSYWTKYMIANAGHMGPNALAVPFIGNGSIDSINSIGITGQFHFTKGDNTQNINLYGIYCLVKNVISFDVSYIPIEYNNMSDEIKRVRHVYYEKYYDKKARGDVMLNTTINLFNKWRKKIHLALRAGYRIPSSSDFGSARFIDGMGYHFDLSMAKPFNSIPLKWIAMAGFYCWQIDVLDLRQNDAFLFGTGLEWNKKGWRIQTYTAGYLGYFANSGDKPVVFRTSAEKRIHNVSLLLRFQQGLNDYKYSSVEFGAKYNFK